MKKLTLIGIAGLIASLHVCGQPRQTGSTPVIASKKIDNPKTIKTASCLQYTITSSGNGPMAHKGDNVKVLYTGKFTNDTIFDSSAKHGGAPFEFMLGRGRVIKAWDEAISYLHVGDKATLIVPPAIGYGDQATGSIPAGSTLIFDVELTGVSEGLKQFEIKKHTDTVKTASGLKYIKVVSNPKGVKPIDSGKVTINYIVYLADGSILDASSDRGKPISFPFGEKQGMKGWDECLQLMKTGEKTRFIVPYQMAYGEEGYKGAIPPKATLIYDLELIDAKAPIKVVPYNVKGKDTLKTSSGLKYIVVKKDTGMRATAGKSVKVHYTGYLDSGKIFDSSIVRDEPIEFPLGQGNVIKGWDEGIALMNIGDKIRLIIPFELAYGEAGRPPQIPPRSELIFDVELMGVK